MATRTIGFAVDEADEPRLDRLAEKLAHGNRSALLRMALDQLEVIERAERLRSLQSYGAQRAAERGVGPADVDSIVHKVLRSTTKKK